MPRANKRKKQSSEDEEEQACTALASASSSDSGPEDRNPPPKKAAAKSTKPAATASKSDKSVQQHPSEDGETSWQLDKQRTLKVRSWKGKTFIDIREYYEKDGKQLPGKKGISLNPSQWSKLKSIISEVDKALEEI